MRDGVFGLEDVWFLAVFLVFNVWLVAVVDGLVAKAWFVGWAACVLAAAAYFWRSERNAG